MTVRFDGFYFSDREHIEHVGCSMYRVPAGVWFTAVWGLRQPDGHPGVPDSLLLMAHTKDELRKKVQAYGVTTDGPDSPAQDVV